MNILIVDDNTNNRMVLRLLLEDYASENGTSYEIDEKINGLEAVNAAKNKEYDLIFMDIMMPEMDGIEATKQIRANNKEVMIIAVSAVDDEARQKEILRNGAEDYVPKPIDAEQLSARLNNYFALLNQRHVPKHSSNSKSVNLYTKDIFHRQIIFYVENEEALSEFWEYYLLGSESLKVDNLCDVVRAVFALGDAIVKSATPWIIVEADDESLYFTINKLEMIGTEKVDSIMQKNSEVTEFIRNSEKISFKLAKNISSEEEKGFCGIAEANGVFEKELEESGTETETVVPATEIAATNVDEYRVFNYMDPEDLLETEDVLGDLSSLMLMMGRSEIEPAEVADIAHFLDKLGRGLLIYTESYKIGQALIDLSQSISSHANRFQEIASDLSTLSSAFVSDLQSWLNLTFYQGAPSVDFMDDTITANTQTIISILSAEDDDMSGSDDMDDIFDF